MPVVTSRVLENGNVAAPDSPDAKKVAATLMIELGEGSGDCGTGVAHMPRRLAHLLHPCVGIAILVSGLHCNDDGIDGNDGSGGAGVAILPRPSCCFVPLCLACHRVSGHLLDKAWRRSLSKMLI